MKWLLIGLVLSLILPLHAQQWEVQSPLPVAGSLNSVYFLNSSIGFIGGDGCILRTADGGDHWTTVSRAGSPNCFWFTDPLNGWAGGSNELLLRTVNGGLTWDSVQAWSWFDADNICFTSPTNGWIFGWPILHTSNGGASWDSVGQFGISTPSPGCFADSLHGWAVASDPNALLRTVDGGVTWSPCYTPNLSHWVLSVNFADADHGWIVVSEYDNYEVYAASHVLHSSDGGLTWSEQFEDSTATLSVMCFRDANHGCIPTNGAILSTGDGGQTWQRRAVPTDGHLTAICTVGAGEYRAVGDCGEILRSPDNGSTWQQQSHGLAQEYLQSIEFSDSRHGWAAGALGNTLRTTDGGGQWWIGRFPLERGMINDIESSDSLTVWASTRGEFGRGNVYHSTDGGQTWSPQFADSIPPMFGLSFPNARNGWAVGRDSVYHTSDGGDHWYGQASSDDLEDVFFYDTLNGWASGQQQWVSHTSNGGRTWERQMTESGTGISDLVFTTPLIGWARTGNQSSLQHTTDGGAHWTTYVLHPDWPWTSAMAFADPLHGYIIAVNESSPDNVLWTTTDGGETWICDLAPLPITDEGIDMTFTSPQSGWLIAGRSILHYSGPLKASAQAALPPVSYSLSASPNPFNPTTVLSFDVPKSARVQLAIYDITGRLVQTLADRMYPQGSYRMSFDGSSLSSGIYFARLQGNSFSKTQKLVLLK